jgi:alpha-glucosidase
VLARRHGKAWYIGAMTGDQARTQKVPLGFLPTGNWRARIWQDGEVVREVRRTERKVTRKDVLSLSRVAAGAAAVVLEPLPAP